MIKKQKTYGKIDFNDVKGIFPNGVEKEKEELSRVFRKENSII